MRRSMKEAKTTVFRWDGPSAMSISFSIAVLFALATYYLLGVGVNS